MISNKSHFKETVVCVKLWTRVAREDDLGGGGFHAIEALVQLDYT